MGSPLCSGAIPALLGQSLSQVAGAEARRVGTELTPFPLSACFPCPSTGTLPPEWGRGVVMKQGGPLLVSAADRGSGCLLRTACPVPAIVRDTISGPNLPCPSELVIAPPPAPTPSLCVLCLLWSSWGHVDSWHGWVVWADCRQVLDFPAVFLEPLLPHPDATPGFPRPPRRPSHPPASPGTRLLCVGSQDWDIPSMAGTADSPGQVSAQVTFLSL